jgi:Ca2+-binding EF-hand superfamily protein
VQKGFDALDRNKDGVLSQEDFSDVSEGMQKLQDWLDDLLRPFLPSEEPPSEEPKGRTQVF